MLISDDPARESSALLAAHSASALLRRAIVLAILALLALWSVLFGSLLVAGEATRSAAMAGAREAVLPEATAASVQAAAARQLAGWYFSSGVKPVRLMVNGRIQTGLIRLHPGDRVAVTVGIDSDWIAPGFVKFLGFSLTGHTTRTCYTTRAP